MPCSIPRWTESGARWLASCAFPRGFLPCPYCLPRLGDGSASTSLLSRPAQASHALRPAELLTHHTWGFIARLRPGRFPGSGARKLSSSTNNLLQWVLPPLVICAVEAHPQTPLHSHNAGRYAGVLPFSRTRPTQYMLYRSLFRNRIVLMILPVTSTRKATSLWNRIMQRPVTSSKDSAAFAVQTG